MRSLARLAQRLLPLERAARRARAASDREQLFTCSDPGGVYAQSSDLWQSAPGPCARLSRTAQSHRPTDAGRTALCPAALQVSSRHYRQPSWRADRPEPSLRLESSSSQPGLGHRCHRSSDRPRLALSGRSARSLQPAGGRLSP